MDLERFGLEDVPIRRGAIAGGVAWVGGLAVTAVILTLFIAEGASVGSTIFTYSLFHIWPVIVGGIGVTLLFWLVPLAILFGTGYWVAANAGAEGWIATGVAVTAGYLPLSALSHAVAFGPAAAVSVPVIISGVAMPMVVAGLAGTFAN
jgi:hypothetical protein